MAQAEFRRGLVRVIPIRGLHVTRVLAVSERKPVTRAASAVINLVVELLDQLVKAQQWAGAEVAHPPEIASE
jgi:hypothetical protein